MSVQHTPTDEQLLIGNSSVQKKVIEAYAGCGKSWVLHREAQLHPDERILYLVYGRKAKVEAEGLFRDCSNVDVRTIHGHAYRQESGQWETSEYALTIGTCYRNVHKMFEGKNCPDEHEIGWIIYTFLTWYLNNIYNDLVESLTYFRMVLNDEKNIILARYEEEILFVSEQFLNDWVTRKTKCPHDFYLKYSFQCGTFAKGLQRYNRILLDEAQDLSPIMFACLEGYSGNLVVVGDSYQSIYSFRYALNALAHIDYDSVFTLSKSFRFGEVIAEYVTDYMQALVNPQFQMTGNDQIQSQLIVNDWVDYDMDYVVLSRTNLELVSRSFRYTQHKQPFHFEKDIGYVFDKLEDIWHLSKYRRRLIKDEFLRTFESCSDLERYAKKVEDSTIVNLLSILDVYQHEFPEILYDLQEHVGNTKIGIALSTVHTAKGQEYKNVRIAPDLYRNVERDVVRKQEDSEEMRILYVALTRAREVLILPHQFEETVYNGWSMWRDRRQSSELTQFWK